jgi:hypothetical protein
MPRWKYDKPPKLGMNFDEAIERFAAATPKELAATEAERVRLVEQEGVAHPLLIYSTPKSVNVDLAYRGSTLWATQDQMADMFGVDRTSVTKHLKSIYDEGELERSASQEGGREVKRERPIYNLSAIISVGYPAISAR